MTAKLLPHERMPEGQRNAQRRRAARVRAAQPGSKGRLDGDHWISRARIAHLRKAAAR